LQDLGDELYRLGVPVKTRHNEVAPSQFELAPIFEDITVSADHNALTMETMKRIAHEHGFMCLLHEKPFAALNGSGKHCNWSLRNDKGENLLEPGKTPHQNLRFLAVLGVVIKAVHENAAVLAASICSPGNEHRLGGNEAPPTIVSIFLGSMIEKIYDSICKGEAATASDEEIMSLGVGHLPKFARDYTDRNRTSPFAFTGNKFEFRAVGSSSNVSVPMTILNAAVAKAMRDSSAELAEAIKGGSSRDEAVVKWIGKTVTKHKAILFSGNNYSDEWKREAESRGLPILDHCGDAFKILGDQKLMAFITDMGVLGESEIELRANIHAERYVSTLAIEAEVLVQIVNDFVIPAAEDQLLSGGDVSDLLEGKAAKLYDARKKKLQDQFAIVLENKDILESQLDKLEGLEEDLTAAVALIQSDLRPTVAKLRDGADAIEQMVADRLWGLPKYRKLLFAHA
jgi:glutamine synthetase